MTAARRFEILVVLAKTEAPYLHWTKRGDKTRAAGRKGKPPSCRPKSVRYRRSGVGVDVDVSAGRGVAVAVSVARGVAVSAGRGVAVGVAVSVGRGVAVGVAVSAGRGVGVAEGAGRGPVPAAGRGLVARTASTAAPVDSLVHQ